MYFLLNCPDSNAQGPHWLSVNIGSVDGLVLSANSWTNTDIEVWDNQVSKLLRTKTPFLTLLALGSTALGGGILLRTSKSSSEKHKIKDEQQFLICFSF